MSATSDRRAFLGQMGLGAGLVAGGCQATARGYPANETIHLGCIGTGGRCRQLMATLKDLPGVRIVAVCDVWDDNLARGKELAAPRARATKNYEALLADKSIDAVIIGTPDHLHVPIAVDACTAGKDVYVEKPLTHDRAEGRAVIDAKNRHDRIVQVGMQQRSMPHLIEARRIIASGELGEIRKVHLTWNRNVERTPKPTYNIHPDSVDWRRFLGKAKDQPFDEYRFRNWRWFWDFGGGIFTDLMVHYVDVAHWFLGLDHPETAASIGSFFTKKDAWETPDTVQTLLQYNSPETQVHFEGTFCNARYRAKMEYMGSEATLYCDRGRYEVLPEPGKQVKQRKRVLGSGPRGLDFYDVPNGELLHLGNWLECVRTRNRPNAPVEVGVTAAGAAHLANAALREDGVARW